MARRVSWTNNSSGHTGTYVYRAATLDPQNLPAPVTTVDPVAQGATAEWIDNETLAAGDYDYAVQDFDGGGVGALSALEIHSVVEDYASAQIGDEIGGGIYVGIITYADSRQFHLVATKQSGEAAGLKGSTISDYNAVVDDPDDGLANTQALYASNPDIYLAAAYCFDHLGDGKDDWYLPSRNELALVVANLANSGHPEFQEATSTWRWSSSRKDGGSIWARGFDGTELFTGGNRTDLRTRPVRRVVV